jgi:hypothetical protein
MNPGPILIVLPDGCSTPVAIDAGNTGDPPAADGWSDGKRAATGPSDQPWLRKHPAEGVLFWDHQWTLIDRLPSGADPRPDPWRELPDAATPDDRDLLHVIATGMGDDEGRLRHLRTRLWWAGNDPIRATGYGALPPIHIDNLLKLALLLDPAKPCQRLLKAETFRELGFFEEAIRLFQEPGGLDERQRELAKLLTRQCLNQNSRVVRLEDA